jgi:hypothetical protein
MADTIRTRAALLALLADNVTGQISAQDLRDVIVTMLPAERAYEADFFAQPDVRIITTDKTCRGALIYSQTVDVGVSFGNILYQRPSGTWSLANVAESAKNARLAIPLDSYISGYSQCILMLWGILYNSYHSSLFSSLAGRPVYLGSTGSEGSIAVVATANSVKVIGYVLTSDTSTVVGIGKWFFDPTWEIVGS